MASEVKGNQEKRRKVELDRLGSLPTHVMDEILKRLPLKDVVRTCILSWKWRYRWMSIPQLVFTAPSSFTPSSAIDRDTKLARIVNDVLYFHNGNVLKFELRGYLDVGCSDVDKWILWLARRNFVKQFTLIFRQPNNGYQVPSSLFRCQNLSALTLGCCQLSLPRQKQGFSNLRTLELYAVTFSDHHTLATLVSNSPLLQTITMVRCNVSKCLSLSLTNLEFFFYLHCRGDISFDHTPRLAKLVIVHSLPGPKEGSRKNKVKSKLEDVLAGLINIKNIFVDMQNWAVCVVPERLPYTFHHLCWIKLRLCFNDSKEILPALCLLRSSPCLRQLDIECRRHKTKERLPSVENFWQGQHLVETVFPKLQRVTLINFSGVQCELGFVYFILMKAVMLKNLKIKWMQYAYWPVRNEMMQIQRAHPEVEIEYLA